LRRLMKVKVALILGAFLFGAYHMNSVQGAYGFILGCLIIYAYEYFGDYRIPVILHMAANLISYSLSYTDIAVNGFVNWPVCIIFLGVGIWALKSLSKQKSVF